MNLASVGKDCQVCFRRGAHLRPCPRCNRVYYCAPRCRDRDEPRHARHCAPTFSRAMALKVDGATAWPFTGEDTDLANRCARALISAFTDRINMIHVACFGIPQYTAFTAMQIFHLAQDDFDPPRLFCFDPDPSDTGAILEIFPPSLSLAVHVEILLALDRIHYLTSHPLFSPINQRTIFSFHYLGRDFDSSHLDRLNLLRLIILEFLDDDRSTPLQTLIHRWQGNFEALTISPTSLRPNLRR